MQHNQENEMNTSKNQHEKGKFLYSTKKNFFEKTNNALLGIEAPEIPQAIFEYAMKQNVQVKPEFHASVIATRNGSDITKKLAILEAEQAKAIQDQIKDLFEKYAWQYELTSQYHLLEKFYTADELRDSGYGEQPDQTRRTIVQGISMPDMKPFYDELNTLLGTSFEVPAAHVTLFAGCDYEPMTTRGIGLYTEKDFLDAMKEEIKIGE